jgi:hypothetical protein
MLVPLAAMWVPVAVSIALTVGLLAFVLWGHVRRAGPDGDEHDSDSDEGGGGSGRRRPRRPPPVGPVSWQDFERQFAAYVERRETVARCEQPRTGADDDGTRDTAGASRRAG